MTELVLLHHNEPMTTSLAIAEGTQNTHQAIMKMVRAYVEQLQKFGEVGFQIRLNPQGSPTEFAFLNEPQSTLLITFLRNSEIVVAFKVALVQAFYELRNHALAGPSFETRNISHGADLAVAADRTFRSFLRAARSAGMALPQALGVANRQTIARTGMDMLAAIGPLPEEPNSAPVHNPVAEGIAAWAETAGAGAWLMEDVLRAAFALAPDDREWPRVAAAAGPALRKAGFERRRRWLRGGTMRSLWERGS